MERLPALPSSSADITLKWGAACCAPTKFKLGEDLVAEAAVGDAADHFFGVHGIGETEVDGAGFVERFYLVGREGDVGAGHVVLELGEFACADDGDYRDGAIAQPREGDLRHAAADLIGDGFQRFNDAIGALLVGQEVFHHCVAHAAVVSGRIFAVIFAAENSAGEGRPGGDADVECFRRGDEFALDGALDEAVFDLHGDEGRPTAKMRERVGLRDPPCGSVGDSDVENFALANEVVECAHGFFGGSELIPDVHPVEIDVIGFEALQAGLDGLDHVFAVIAGGVCVGGGK
jgi:hypothetical protein